MLGAIVVLPSLGKIILIILKIDRIAKLCESCKSEPIREVLMSTNVYKIDSPTAVIGELAKIFQEKYGAEALALFKPVLREYGFHTGSRLRKKMADKNFTDRVESWLEPIMKTGLGEVVEKGPAHITIRGTNCPLNLDQTNGDLCDTCMCIDEGLVSALAEKEITLRIDQSIARGDQCCLVTFAM